MGTLFILQSGFQTPDTTRLVRNQNKDLSFKESLYASEFDSVDTDNYYDDTVEKLFSRWNKDNALMRRFEFRQEILETALRVFATPSGMITDWVAIQQKQRTVGYLHRKFLQEMLLRATNVESKTLDNQTYYRLLQAQESNNHIQGRQDGSDEALGKYVKNHSVLLVDVLRSWTRDIDGFCDLLSTIHVIFGHRRGFLGVQPVDLRT